MERTQTPFHPWPPIASPAKAGLDLNDVAAIQAQALDRLQSGERNRFQLNINQPVGERGIYFNGIRRDHWGDQGRAAASSSGYNRGLTGAA